MICWNSKLAFHEMHSAVFIIWRYNFRITKCILYRLLSARLIYIHCIRNQDTIILHLSHRYHKQTILTHRIFNENNIISTSHYANVNITSQWYTTLHIIYKENMHCDTQTRQCLPSSSRYWLWISCTMTSERPWPLTTCSNEVKRSLMRSTLVMQTAESLHWALSWMASRILEWD